MINLKEFPLTYFCRETGKEFRAKKIITGLYSMVDPESGITQKITTTFLRKNFKPAKTNHFVVTKNKYARPRIYPSKEYQEYLNEKSGLAV